MRKLVVIVACLIAIMTLGVLAASAETQAIGQCWVNNAKNIDEILEGRAGEGDIAWEVPFLDTKPTIDGKIGKDEYYEFALYQDYLSWMSGNEDAGISKELFEEFYNASQYGFFDAYWGWDGTYMYIAFEIECINGYICTPEERGSDALLYSYNCLQVGFADVMAVGRDPSYKELGFGVHSVTGEPIAVSWNGNYTPQAGTDFQGSYDPVNQVVVYEARVHLQTVMGLEDRVVENGDEINYAWLLSVNGQSKTTDDWWQVAFCHGIGGQYSYKETSYFARISFTGKPDDLDVNVENIGGDASEEDKSCNILEIIDWGNTDVAATLIGENVVIETMTEDDVNFVRLTAFGENSYVYSSKYPRSTMGALCKYVVVKYRTESDGELGIIWKTPSGQEFLIGDSTYTQHVGGDNEWHVAIFYMEDESNWEHFISNLGVVLFMGEGDATGKKIDIAYIKTFGGDPYTVYDDLVFDPEATVDTDATETAGEDIQVGDDTLMVDTENAVVSGEATSETTDNQEKGCSSSLGMGGLVLFLLPFGAAALLVKKSKMRGKRTLLCLTLTLVMMLTLVACTGGETPSDTQPQDSTAITEQGSGDIETTIGGDIQDETGNVVEPGSDADTNAQTQPETEPETEPVTEPETEAVRVIENRYFIFRVSNQIMTSQDDFEALVDTASDTGFNVIQIQIPWSIAQFEEGSINLNAFDAMVDYAIGEGLYVSFMVDMSRTTGDDLVSSSKFMCKSDDSTYLIDGYRTQVSFGANDIWEKAITFYQTVVERYDEKCGDKVLFYMPTFTPRGYTEYGTADYSLMELKAFHQYLEEKYENIAALNAVLGTSYSSFAAVNPPTARSADSLNILWYQFRHAQLKGIIDAFATAHDATESTAKMAVQFSTVASSYSADYGTLSYADLCENVDIVLVSDVPTMDHRFSMDYLNNTLPVDVEFGNTIMAPNAIGASTENYRNQALQSYKLGATYVTLEGWGMDKMNDYMEYEEIWEEVALRWLSGGATTTIDRTTSVSRLQISLFEMFSIKHTSCNEYFSREYNRCTSDGSKSVLVTIVDDLTTFALEKPRQIYSFWDDYSDEGSTEGVWSYGVVKDDTVVPMTWTGSCWRDGEDFPLLERGSAIAGVNDIAIIFTVPEDGTLSLHVIAQMLFPQGDGVCIYVNQNEKHVYPKDFRVQRVLPGEQVLGAITLEVKAGDQIVIGINQNGNNGFDNINLDIRAELVVEE